MFYKSLLLLCYVLVLKIRVLLNVIQSPIPFHYLHNQIDFVKYPADRNPWQ